MSGTRRSRESKTHGARGNKGIGKLADAARGLMFPGIHRGIYSHGADCVGKNGNGTPMAEGPMETQEEIMQPPSSEAFPRY